MAKTTPHQITDDERAAIIDAARDEANPDMAHRKLAHHLSRTAQAFVSESTVLLVLRSGGTRVPLPGARRRPKSIKPETVVEAPNEIWAWDISYCRVGTRSRRRTCPDVEELDRTFVPQKSRRRARNSA